MQHILGSISKTAPLTITLCLLLAGDIETNPGPNVYPCALCDLEVTWTCKALCCDGCNVWIHTSCVDINSAEYSLLGKSAVPWLCPRCDTMNCDTFTFNSFEISCYNSFAPLASALPTDDSKSFSSDINNFSPKFTSSPHQKNETRNASDYSRKLSSLSSSSSPLVTKNSNVNDTAVFDLPRKSNLRVLNVNCQSVKSKRSELLTSLQYVKPDIVCATETWLRGIKPGKPPSPDTISSSEIFPNDYNIYRNDRNALGGGVLIMTHKSLTVEEQPQLVTNCECNWVKVKLQNLKDLYIGVFYMAHRNENDLKELNKSLELIERSGNKDIILAGDFNCPDIDWETNTVPSGAQDRDVQQRLADTMSSSSLTQVHAQPTRLAAMLDIVLTSNPTLLKNSSSIPGLSDHDMVVSDFDTKPHLSKEKPKQFYKYRQAKWELIEKDLENILTEIEDQYKKNCSADNLWTTFKSRLQHSMKNHIPMGTVKKNTKLPWINRQLLRQLRKKQRLYRQAKTTNNWSKYRTHQKYCKRELKKPSGNLSTTRYRKA